MIFELVISNQILFEILFYLFYIIFVLFTIFHIHYFPKIIKK